MVLHSVDMHSYVVAFCPQHGSAMHVILLSFQTPGEVLTQDQVVSAHHSFINILSRKFKTNHLSQVEHHNLVVSKSMQTIMHIIGPILSNRQKINPITSHCIHQVCILYSDAPHRPKFHKFQGTVENIKSLYLESLCKKLKPTHFVLEAFLRVRKGCLAYKVTMSTLRVLNH